MTTQNNVARWDVRNAQREKNHGGGGITDESAPIITIEVDLLGENNKLTNWMGWLAGKGRLL